MKSSNLHKAINAFKEEPQQSHQAPVADEPQKWLRELLLTMNSTALITAHMKLAISLYLVFGTKMFWWGITYLLMSTSPQASQPNAKIPNSIPGLFGILVIIIYFPLIWKSVRLDAVKVVLVCLIISHFIDAGFTLSHVVRSNRKMDDREYLFYICVKGLHLGVVFSSFTYYWRLYNVSSVAATRRSTV
ncbi:hypothetical protein HUJ04_003397 [Dendroctonus ponderosae]|nr:hypothetical protein HUJ04_003397 [Dendroctonus ponderosae]